MEIEFSRQFSKNP